MSDAQKLKEAKKAEIMETAKRRADELDRDFSEMERLHAKYGLTFGPVPGIAPPTPTAPLTPTHAANGVHGAARGNPQSATARSKAESEKIIRELNRPVPLSELFEKVTARGVKIGGKNPKWVLSSNLGQAPTLISTPDGWWLKDEPLPEKKASLGEKLSGGLSPEGGRHPWLK